MDTLKRQLAEALDRRVTMTPELDDVAAVEVTRTDNLNWSIRVVTMKRGTRYFSVKLSEHF
jgi:hypothetical protein